MDKKKLTGILKDSRHNFWISTGGPAFYKYNALTKKISTYSLTDITKTRATKINDNGVLIVKCFFEDNHHNIWIGTANGGLLQYNQEKNSFTNTTNRKNNKQGLQYNYEILCIFQDKEENIWLGTDKGIDIFNPYRQYYQSIHHEENNTSSIPKNEIMNFIQAANGDIIAGTWGGGITVYDSKWNFKNNISFSGPYEYNLVWSFIQNDDGNIWIGCQHGFIHIYNPSSGAIQTIHPPELNNKTIWCITKDSRGNIWMGLHDGKIAEWNKQQNKFYRYNDSVKGIAQVYAPVFNIFFDSKQRCWVSTLTGFKQFDTESRMYAAVYVADKNNAHSISANTTEGIEEYDDSTLLIGTVYGGLNFFNPRNKTFSQLTEKNGLPANTIHAIKKDSAGYVWFTTDYDLYKFKPADKKFIRFNIEPGAINTEFKTASFYPLQDGRWLTGTTAEMICFYTKNNFVPQNADTKVEITGFKIFNNNLLIDSLPDGNKLVKLSYQQNFLTLEFALLNFSNLQQTNYYYRLDGVDKEWVSAGTKNFANYTNLEPGQYTFTVKAGDGKETTPGTSFKIIITPPFWKSWWFILLLVICTILMLYQFIKWRVRSVKAVEAEKLKVQQLNAEQYKNKLELEQIINYFSSSLIDKNRVDDVLWDVAKNLIGRLGFADCILYLWNDDKSKMIQKAGFGPKGTVEQINKQPFDVVPGQGVVGYVMRTKEPVLIPDTSQDSRYRPDEMVRLSEITVPVIYNNELIGVIDSEHPEKNFFTQQHLQIMNTIATLMADKIKSIEAEQSLRQTHIEMYSINEQLLKAKLEALRSQMNPHFIFNSLNAIDNLIQTNQKEKATTYLARFAKLIRNVLDSSKNDVVAFQKDYESLQLYLQLEQFRCNNKFTYELVAEDELLQSDYKVPPLIVQPFVENAIHHGLLNKENGDKKLTVSVTLENDFIKYTVNDNGVGRTKAQQIKDINKPGHQSYGINITKERIHLYNQNGEPNEIDITDLFENNEPCGTRVEIKLKIFENT